MQHRAVAPHLCPHERAYRGQAARRGDQPRIVSAGDDAAAAARDATGEPSDLLLHRVEKREVVREARRQRGQHQHVGLDGGEQGPGVPLVAQPHLEDQRVQRSRG